MCVQIINLTCYCQANLRGMHYGSDTLFDTNKFLLNTNINNNMRWVPHNFIRFVITINDLKKIQVSIKISHNSKKLTQQLKPSTICDIFILFFCGIFHQPKIISTLFYHWSNKYMALLAIFQSIHCVYFFSLDCFF